MKEKAPNSTSAFLPILCIVQKKKETLKTDKFKNVSQSGLLLRIISRGFFEK